MPRSVVLGLGSNVGEPSAILQGAVDDLQATSGLDLLAVSRVYETDPVGGPEQPVYLNAAAVGVTTLRDHELLAAVQSIEQHWHRRREVRWGPRTLDVDVIAIDEERSDDPALTIPHPRAHERAFVLVPWLDVDPDAVIPGRGRVDDLLRVVGTEGVRLTSHVLVLGPHREDGP